MSMTEKRSLVSVASRAIAALIFLVGGAQILPAREDADSGREPSFVTVTVQDKSCLVKRHGKEEALFESSRPLAAIEWALNHSRITVLTGGEFNVAGTLNIPRPNVSLIIAQDATLKPAEKAELLIVSEGHGNYRPLIHNKGMDNVAVISLGTLRTPQQRGGACIMFNGRSGGKLGIDGGLVFSAGTMAQCGDAIWLVDSKNLQVPFAGDKSYDNNLMAIEGCEDLEIDVVAGLAGIRSNRLKGNRKGNFGGENESIDLNSYCRRIHIRRMIGASYSEQILDVNNSTDIVVDEIAGYTGGDKFNGHLVDIVNYGPKGRRLTQRPRIPKSENIKIYKKGVAAERISDWKITAEAGDMMKSLPEMRVRVRVIGNPQKEKVTVLDRTYRFNLKDIPKVSVAE